MSNASIRDLLIIIESVIFMCSDGRHDEVVILGMIVIHSMVGFMAARRVVYVCVLRHGQTC